MVVILLWGETMKPKEEKIKEEHYERCAGCGKNVEKDSLLTRICKECSGQNELVEKTKQKTLSDVEKIIDKWIEEGIDSISISDIEMELLGELRKEVQKMKVKQ